MCGIAGAIALNGLDPRRFAHCEVAEQHVFLFGADRNDLLMINADPVAALGLGPVQLNIGPLGSQCVR